MYSTAKQQCLKQEEFDQISQMWNPGSLIGSCNYRTNFRRRTCTSDPIPDCWDWQIKKGRKMYTTLQLKILILAINIYTYSWRFLKFGDGLKPLCPTQTKELPKLRVQSLYFPFSFLKILPPLQKLCDLPFPYLSTFSDSKGRDREKQTYDSTLFVCKKANLSKNKCMTIIELTYFYLKFWQTLVDTS